ncbi:ASCH domain-containing protein, partial [bacterium]|nr:ASCH domain-containing protein [bacterium]
MSSILKGLVDEDTGMDWEEKLMDVWAPVAAKHMAKVVKQAFNSLYPDVKLKVWAEAEGVSATTDLTSDDVKADVFGQWGKKDWECNFFCGPLYNEADDRKYLELMVDDAASGSYPGVWKIIVSEWKRWATSQLKKTGADDVCFSVNEDMSGGAWSKIARAVGVKFIAHDLDEGVAEGSTNIPTIGINIRNDGDIFYADLIVDGKKKYESRRTNSLNPYIGKTVGIVRTGKGPATAIGQVTIGEPIIVDADKFDKLRNKHLVPKNSKFDIDIDGTKYLYPMINPVRWDNEKPIKHKGIVSRKIQERDVAEALNYDREPLYHATLKAFEPSIIKSGLLPGGNLRMFDWSDKKYVY